ncbi:MAG: NAD(P)/FAD-dependent oxidoreductase [Anaerolineales bacterium]
MKEFQVVIIGAGPAGLAAAIQLQRQRIPALILERGQIGGLLNNAYWVENYPGFPEGITGADLADRIHQQAKRLGVIIHHEEVKSVKFGEELFRIATNRREITAKILVAATGTKAIKLSQSANSANLEGKILGEVFPIIHEKGKTILIIGAGDAALDYALNLARYNQVTLLNRGTEIRGLPLLWDRVQENESICYFSEIEIKKVDTAEPGKVSVIAKSGKQESSFCVDYLLTAIGREPELGFMDRDLLNRVGELQDKKIIFQIGDLKNGKFRQTSIAVGDGIRTAMDIGKKLEKG